MAFYLLRSCLPFQAQNRLTPKTLLAGQQTVFVRVFARNRKKLHAVVPHSGLSHLFVGSVGRIGTKLRRCPINGVAPATKHIGNISLGHDQRIVLRRRNIAKLKQGRSMIRYCNFGRIRTRGLPRLLHQCSAGAYQRDVQKRSSIQLYLAIPSRLDSGVGFANAS